MGILNKFNRFIFKKQYEEYKAEFDEFLVELKNENRKLNCKLDLELKRFQRIKYLINNNSVQANKIILEETTKGVEILTVITKRNRFIDILIYDIGEVKYDEKETLKLYAKDMDSAINIQDILGGCSKGHGECAVNHLIEYSKEINKKRITGWLSPVDFDHKDRLFAFYRKLGFDISIDEDGNSGSIELKIF